MIELWIHEEVGMPRKVLSRFLSPEEADRFCDKNHDWIYSKARKHGKRHGQHWVRVICGADTFTDVDV